MWYKHQNEDEMFHLIKGELIMEFRDRTEVLKEGEFIIVPRGVEHKPVAKNEIEVMLFEPKTTLNTGDACDDRKLENLNWI